MYRRWATFGWAVLCGAALAPAGSIDPGLQQVLATKAPEETVSTLVYMKHMVDLGVLTTALDQQRPSLQRRHEVVVRALQEKAQTTQMPVLTVLGQLQVAGRVQSFEPFWIGNIIRVDAPAREIEALARHPDVDTVYYNYEIETIAPVTTSSGHTDNRDDGQRTPEIGLVAIRAPEVWALGYTGEGVLTSTLDTGVDGNHPALHDRWRGLDPLYQGHPQWAWFDPVTNTTFPQAFGAHGTHTMGTILGGAPGDQIGVAPGAQWIHAAVIDRVSLPQTVADAILAFQWLVDPDGNPATAWDVPQVCSNSWGVTTGHGYPPCNQTFWAYIDACEAAGVVVLFSAGNEGPGAESLRRPSDRATTSLNCFAVGAVDASNSTWPIADFSSRGPSHCTPDGSAAIKPEVAAPGVNVRSSLPGGYGQLSGTSMASPHVNGVVTLMRQACPELTVEQIKQILLDTAHDLGTTGDDNSYGKGMVDAYEAVQMALDQCVPHPPTAFSGTADTTVNSGVTITLTGDDDNKPNPPGVLSYVITSLPAHGYLTDPNGGVILGTPHTLAGYGAQAVYQPSAYYTGSDSFTFLANDGGTPPEGGNSNTATISIAVVPAAQLAYSFPLDTDPGWTTQGQWAFGQPTGGGSHTHDPASGHTGNNVYGYNLDGDYPNRMPQYFLTTTAIDCSRVSGTQLRFYRWLGVENYDQATIAVSDDGTAWTTVWQSIGLTYSDSAWSLQTYDISQIADDHPTVYVRWGMGPSDMSVSYPGWNIDDVEIWGLLTLEWVVGDLNCDGVASFADINPFVLRLSNPVAYWTTFPACADSNGDINGDGAVDFGDISPFVALLSQ